MEFLSPTKKMLEVLGNLKRKSKIFIIKINIPITKDMFTWKNLKRIIKYEKNI